MITIQDSASSPLVPEADSPAEALVLRLCSLGANIAGAVSFGTEASHFQDSASPPSSAARQHRAGPPAERDSSPSTRSRPASPSARKLKDWATGKDTP